MPALQYEVVCKPFKSRTFSSSGAPGHPDINVEVPDQSTEGEEQIDCVVESVDIPERLNNKELFINLLDAVD